MEKCRKETTDKIIVFEENRSKLIFLNKKKQKLTKIQVDGCEITTGIRCDNLLISKQIEHFIELKGQDLNHAMDQLKATFKTLSADEKMYKKISFIICTRSPINSTAIQNFRVKFKKNFNSDLIIKSSPHQHTV